MVESTAGQGDDVVDLVTLWSVLVDFFQLDKVRITWYTKTGTIRISVMVLFTLIDWVVSIPRVSLTSGDRFTGLTFPVRVYLSVSVFLRP